MHVSAFQVYSVIEISKYILVFFFFACVRPPEIRIHNIVNILQPKPTLASQPAHGWHAQGAGCIYAFNHAHKKQKKMVKFKVFDTRGDQQEGTA